MKNPARVKFDKVPELRPVLPKMASITAANASTINDGAVAVVVTSEALAKAKGMPILAKIKGYAANAHEPQMFTTAPVGAMQKLYNKLSWTPDAVDLYEINEAFAVVPMAAMHEFNLSADKVNVNGGAIAIGHPIGASGARIVATLVNALKAQGGGRGMASICIGGGEALAMAVEV
ncbi:MAG: thiolase family protein [Deinococcales bacterium]